jgi:iron complex transport system substrate-binding protein
VRTSRLLALGAAAALAVTLSACSSSAPESTASAGSNPASDDAFPVTIEHVYGETTIDEKPERGATEPPCWY